MAARACEYHPRPSRRDVHRRFVEAGFQFPLHCRTPERTWSFIRAADRIGRHSLTKQLQLVDVCLRWAGQTKGLEATAPGVSFIASSIQSSVPANCFIVIDTHADELSGGLQWAGGRTAPKTAPVSEILSEFCGKIFLAEMRASSVMARSCTPPKDPGWYEDSPFLRGGWRGLFVASCAPAVRAPQGFRDLKKLVDEYVPVFP